DKQTPISPLRRPLGVPDLPTTQKRTFAEKTADFLNQDKQLEKRRHLVREASTGYFYDLHMMRVNGGKIWMAPQVLIREEKALYFPNITGSRLDNGVKEHTASICAGKVSVVAILTTQMSEVHVNSYVKRVNERFRGHPGYQFVQINLQENVLKAILVNVFLSSLRSKVPLNLQTRYLVTRQNMDYLREQIGMTNNRIGYVYLVDENMKIRWAACADAWAEEEAALVRCAGVLLSR
ncbi:ATPase assembly factor ATP10, partial [Gloeopeniophorella convolvens]